MIIELLVVSAFLASDANAVDVLRPKTVRIYKFEGTCEGYRNATIILKNIHLRYSSRINLISLVSDAREDIPEDLKLRLELTRCKSREALDSCEKYQSISVNRLCRLLNAENIPWFTLTEVSKPPMKCPIKKGEYFVRNGTLDASAFSHLPIAGWYWIVDAFLLGEKTRRILMCVHFEGQLVSS